MSDTYPDVKPGGRYEAPDGSKVVDVLDVDTLGSIKVRLADGTETWFHPMQFIGWKKVGAGSFGEWFKWYDAPEES